MLDGCWRRLWCIDSAYHVNNDLIASNLSIVAALFFIDDESLVVLELTRGV
jgi:hypothetical protein